MKNSFIVFVVFSVALIGLTSDANASDVCNKDSDCQSDNLCIANECIQMRQDGENCTIGLECLSRYCSPDRHICGQNPYSVPMPAKQTASYYNSGSEVFESDFSGRFSAGYQGGVSRGKSYSVYSSLGVGVGLLLANSVNLGIEFGIGSFTRGIYMRFSIPVNIGYRFQVGNALALYPYFSSGVAFDNDGFNIPLGGGLEFVLFNGFMFGSRGGVSFYNVGKSDSSESLTMWSLYVGCHF